MPRIYAVCFSETGPDQSSWFIRCHVHRGTMTRSREEEEEEDRSRFSSSLRSVLGRVRLRCRGLIILMDVTIVLASWRSPRVDVRAKSETGRKGAEAKKRRPPVCRPREPDTGAVLWTVVEHRYRNKDASVFIPIWFEYRGDWLTRWIDSDEIV